MTFAVVLMSGCSEDKPIYNNGGSRINQENIVEHGSAEAALRSAREASVTCYASGTNTAAECPEAIAFLTRVHGTNTAQCTAVLIDANHVITNSHCLGRSSDAGSLNAGDTCEDSIFLHFAEVRARGDSSQILRSKVSTGCRRVLAKSTLYESPSAETRTLNFANADYALLELTQPVTDHQPLQMASSGLVRSPQHYRIARIDPVDAGGGRNVGSLLVTEGCQVVNQSSIYAGAVDGSPVRVVSGCAIISGNSGGAVMNAAGELSGLLHAGVSEALNGGQVAPFAIATDIRCIETPGRGRASLPPSCQQTGRQIAGPSAGGPASAETTAFLLRDLTQQLSATVKNFFSTIQHNRTAFVFDYGLVSRPGLRPGLTVAERFGSTLDLQQDTTFIPKCFASPHGWIEESRRRSFFGSVSYAPEAHAEFNSYFFRANLGTARDTSSQLQVLRSNNLIKMTVRFSPAEVQRNSAAMVQNGTAENRGLNVRNATLGNVRVVLQEARSADDLLDPLMVSLRLIFINNRLNPPALGSEYRTIFDENLALPMCEARRLER